MLPRGPYRSVQVLPATLLGAITLLLIGCGGSGGGLTFPATTGTLQIMTTTTGEEVDPDGYSVQLDAEGPQGIGTVATLVRTELEPGDHAVFLGGVAPNCSVGGDNPRTVTVKAGETFTATFEVTCSATSGGVVVTTTTTGDSPDPDGYSVILDGADQGPIPSSGQVALTGLALGSHVVGLTGLAGNCQVQGDNLQTVSVTAGATTPVAYTIACSAPPPGAGTLRITTATSGTDADPDGYTFRVDGGPRHPIGVNAADALPNVAQGTHQVELSGVASNCRVQGANPQSITVPAGGTVDASFAISCSRGSGAVRVRVATTGSPADPNGYVATLDGAGPGLRLNNNGSVRFEDVSVGSHTIGLGDLAGNCTVTDGASRTVTVSNGETSEVSFAVSCRATTGTIVVTTQTSGPSPDPDGYTILVDGANRGSIVPSGQATVPGVPTGSRQVRLGGVAANCTIDGDDQRTVTVNDGQSTPVGFTITCVTPQPTTGTIHITTATTGSNPDDGYTVAVDGGASQAIGPNADVTVGNVTPGNHSVQLSDVAGNCTVQGTNPRSANVTAGSTTEVNFSISCPAPPPTTGTIEVDVSTNDAPGAPDGSTVALDGGTPIPVGAGGTAQFTDVSTGNHTVVLSVPDNCQVVAGATRDMVPVAAGQTTTVEYEVTCAAPTGSIAVTTATSGDDPDPDGYTVTLDSGGGQSIADNGPFTFSDVPAGQHSIELSGVATNCAVQSANPTTVTLAGGGSEPVAFNVQCTAPPPAGLATP
jgi:hypothetical protein